MGDLKTGAAKEIANAQYTNMIFNALGQIANLCSDPNISDAAISKRVEFITKGLIAYIPNSKTRETLKQMRKEKVEEAKAKFNKKEINRDEYNDLLIDINTDIIGEISATMNNVLGIVETQEVITILNPEIQKRLEEKFFGSDEDEIIE